MTKTTKAAASKTAKRVNNTAKKAAAEISETIVETTEVVTENVEMAVENSTEAAEGLRGKATELVTDLRGNFREIGDVLKTTGSHVGKGNRDFAMLLLDNTQVNAEIGLDALRETLMAQSLKEAVTVQREALRNAWELNIDQAKDLGQLVRRNVQTAFQPTSEFVRGLRGKTEELAA